MTKQKTTNTFTDAKELLDVMRQALSICDNNHCCQCGVKFEIGGENHPIQPIYVEDDIIWQCQKCNVLDPKGKELFKKLLAERGYQEFTKGGYRHEK